MQIPQNKEIWQTNFQDYLSFWKARKENFLRSDFDEDAGILRIEAEPDKEAVIRVPLVIAGGKKVNMVYGNDRKITFTTIDSYALFVTSQGYQEFKVYYN